MTDAAGACAIAINYGRATDRRIVRVTSILAADIKGFEVMRALRKGQARPWCLQPGIRGEVRLIERAFGIGPSALTEAVQLIEQDFQMAA